jgi:chromosome segregation ATPase
LSETRVEVERLEGDLNLASERLANATSRKERALVEHQQATEHAKQADRERDAAAAEREAAESARQSVQTELDLRSAGEEEVRERLASHRELVRETEASSQRQAEILRALQGERTAIEHELEELGEQKREVEARRDVAARTLDAAHQQLEQARAELDGSQRQERAAVSQLE